jgi:branched-chain amino acid transport system substrate-binding protein
MTRRHPLWRILAALAVLSLVAAACGDDNDDNTTAASDDNTDTSEAPADGGGDGGVTCEDISLGFFGALTGEAANLGINIAQGAQLAINQFNEENPDCQVGYEEFDSQGSPDQAPALAQEAIGNDSVVGIIGPAFSGESRAANPIFDEAGLPIITPSATGVDLSEQGWSIFHRALGNDASQGPAAATYILNELGATKIAVIDDASEYGKGIADIVRETVQGSDAELSTSQSIDPTSQDFSATVNAIRADAPDAIFYGGYYAEAGRLLKQLRDAGVETTFVSDDGAKDPGLVEAAGGDTAEGAIVTCPCAPIEDIEGGEEFAAAYAEAFDGAEAGTYSAEAYDSANAFLEAIKAGNTDRESINTYLNEELDFAGITKTLSFDEKGEVAEVTIYAYKVEGGEIVAVGAIEG